MDDVLLDYLAVCETDCSERTLKGYRGAFKAFQAYLTAQSIDFKTITHAQVQGFVTYRSDLKSTTLKTQLKAVRAAFNYAKHQTLTISRVDDPFRKIRYPQVPDTEPITYTDSEIRQLFDAIQTDREWIAFHVMAYAGLRAEELCSLTWEDVDFTNKHIRVLGKGNKLRRVPLHPKLASALKDHKQADGYVIPTVQWSGWRTEDGEVKEAGTKLSVNALWRSNDLWYKRAGIEKAHNHCFRRTMASVLREKGVSTEDRDAIMGWAPKDVGGRHYTRNLPETLSAAIRKLDYGIADPSRAKTEKKEERHLELVA